MPEEKPPSAKKLTPKQRKLVALFPAIAAGSISVEEAMKRAGYSAGSARQQSKVMSGVRHSSAMQNALRKAGVTEEKLAGKIKDGLKSYNKDTIHKFVQLAAKLLDAFPAERNIVGIGTVEEALDEAEGEVDYADFQDSPSAK